jgi:DNA-binding MarR family transcriptional regulator
MQKTIYLPKWTELVVALYNAPAEHRYCGKLYRKTGMTTRHVRNLISQLERMHIVKRQHGRKVKYIHLTTTGERLAELLIEIFPTLKR